MKILPLTFAVSTALFAASSVQADTMADLKAQLDILQKKIQIRNLWTKRRHDINSLGTQFL